MSTESWEVHSSVCPCGNGRLVVTHHETDHPWQLKTWIRSAIECASCDKAYALVEQGGHVVLVRAEAVERRERLKPQAHELSVALEKSPAVETIIANAVERVDALPSKAAVHRALKGVISMGGIASFRKAIESGGSVGKWLRKSITPYSLPAVMIWLNVTNPEVEAQLTRIQTLRREAEEPLPEEKVVYER